MLQRKAKGISRDVTSLRFGGRQSRRRAGPRFAPLTCPQTLRRCAPWATYCVAEPSARSLPLRRPCGVFWGCPRPARGRLHCAAALQRLVRGSRAASGVMTERFANLTVDTTPKARRHVSEHEHL